MWFAARELAILHGVQILRTITAGCSGSNGGLLVEAFS
jgi:hypothetical protein